MHKILYAVTVDTEEDWDWSAGWPVTSYGTQNFKQLPRFQQLCANQGARVTWLADWVAITDPRGRELLQAFDARGDAEVGMHIHPWTTPPHPPGHTYGQRESYLATYAPGEIRAKLASVWEAFQDAGLTPQSFRGGRYSSGDDVQRFLAENGFTADCSVVPFTSWPEDGAPDYRNRNGFPTRLSFGDDKRFLWEIPVTLGFTRRNFRFWAAAFDTLSGPLFRRLRPIGILSKLGIVQRVWLNLEDTPARDMERFLTVIRRLAPPCITFTVHSSSLHVGGNPYSQTRQAVETIWRTAETVLGRLAEDTAFQSATICEIAQHLEEQHEGDRNQSAR